VRSVVFASPLALVVCVGGCRRSHARAVKDPAFGVLGVGSPSFADLSADLRWVRAALEGSDAPPPKRAVHAPARRAFVSVFTPHEPPLVVSALGDDLASSLQAVVRSTRDRLETFDLAHARIELDLAVARGAPSTKPLKIRPLGRVGLARVLDPLRVGFILPGEIFTRRLLGEDEGPELDEEVLHQTLAERLDEDADVDATPLAPFETVAVVESQDHAVVLPLVRGLLPRVEPSRIDASLLRRRITLAADYLARICDERGKFVYVYDPIRDVDSDDDYSIIRHAGAADGLLEAYEELHDPRYLAAAERALAYLAGAMTTVPSDPDDPSRGDFTYLADDDNALAPIGGTGLALVAFAKHVAVTKSERWLPLMRSMARFLYRQLGPDGVFKPYFPPGQSMEVREVLYYPGEAMLGLVRAFAADPDPRWIEAAERAARRRAIEPQRARDFWYLLACAELHRRDREPLWSERVYAIAEATAQEHEQDEIDFAHAHGSYGRTPRASPTSTALEAVAATVALARFDHQSESRWMDMARRMASFVLWEQLDEDAEYYVADPQKALGGVRTNPWGSNVRIDNDQHAILGWLTLLEVMRDPSFGS